MTRDPRQPMGGDPLDDAAIGQLVRDVAEGWTMPPVRLDAPSWRDRVRTPRARRLAAAAGWARRLGPAATAAVALTVAGALIAIVITRPPSEPGRSPGASTPGTPAATGQAEATSLPKLLVTGELPDPSTVLVSSEGGDFALANLADGSLGPSITGSTFGSELRRDADGTMVCLCLSTANIVRGTATRIAVSLDRFDAAGERVSTTPIDSYSGEPDPRDAASSIPMDPPHVIVTVGFSDDGRYGYVGWSGRAQPTWHSGLAVVDLRSGSLVGSVDLPDGSAGDGDTRRVEMAPHVVGPLGSNGILISRDWWGWTPAGASNPPMTFGTSAFRARFGDGALSDLTAIPAASDCGDTVLRGGTVASGAMWLACGQQGGSQTIVRRLGADGSFVGDVRGLGSPAVDFGGPVALAADGSTLFVWDATTMTITRIDLATGDKISRSGLAAAASDPLTAIGNWLAPATAAKSFIRGSVVLSPDGTTVYAIGIKGNPAQEEIAGSAGILVFDAVTLERQGVWQPTADYVSIALSPDGSSLYAAGMPGVDALGIQRPTQGASITVFDTTDGSQQLIAGQLGPNLITFASPVVGATAE